VYHASGHLVGIIDKDFRLGKPYTLKLGVGKGKANIWYQTSGKGSLDKPAFSLPVRCRIPTFFKTGEL
jgi:hypothetical protein